MNNYRGLTRKQSFLYPGLLYVILYCALLPGYRFLVDADATGYLQVAEQIANGKLYYSINGVWSPLGSWLLAPFIWLGADGILAAKWLNGLYSLISLGLIHRLLLRYRLRDMARYSLLLAAMLLLLHCSLSRLFADLLLLVLLLLYFSVVTAQAFGDNNKKIALAAAIGAVGFYAKSYTFYFVLFHLPATLVYLHYTNPAGRSFTAVTKQVLYALTIVVLLCLPWAFAMQYKYHNFAFSNTGRYNITGGLLIDYTQSAGVFFAPPNPGGYSIWDDPYKTFTLHPGSTPPIGPLLLRQAKITAANCRDLLITLFHFSWLLMPLWLGVAAAVKKQWRIAAYPAVFPISVLFILLWCGGYSLLHIEDRFFWILPLLTLVLTGALLQEYSTEKTAARIPVAAAIVALSFCMYPAHRLWDNYNRGKQTFDMAAAFQRQHIGGNIMSLQQDNDDMDNTVLLNYLLKGRYYGPIRNTCTWPQLEKAVAQFNINYVILYYHSAAAQTAMLAHPLVKQAAAVLTEVYPGVVVLRF